MVPLEVLYLVLFLFAILGFLLGLRNPRSSLPKFIKPSRVNVVLFYILIFSLIYGSFQLTDPGKEDRLARKEIAKEEKIRKKEYKQAKKTIKERNKMKKKVSSKNKKYYINDSNLTSDSALEDSDRVIGIRAAVRAFLDDLRGKTIKSIDDELIVVYSSKPIKDKANKVYKYSFIITGRYSELLGDSGDFAMILVGDDSYTRDRSKLKLIYLLDSNSTHIINKFHPDDDVHSKLGF